jgi:uncharacterized iron-regulated membrane protein
MTQMSPLSRRRLLRSLAATGASALFHPQLASSQQARVAIPATTRVDHVQENMAAATELLPDQATRARMIAHVEKL